MCLLVSVYLYVTQVCSGIGVCACEAAVRILSLSGHTCATFLHAGHILEASLLVCVCKCELS